MLHKHQIVIIMKVEKEKRILNMKSQVNDILIEISWREIAIQYFGKSSSWLYHKMDGLDNGFTPEEATKLKESLIDLSKRIKNCAENIKIPETNCPTEVPN